MGTAGKSRPLPAAHPQKPPDMMRYAALMKRTTVMLPEDTDARLRLEARRRGVPIAVVVRDAVEHHLPPPSPGRRPAFFAIGEEGPADSAERVDEIVLEVFNRRHRDRQRQRRPD